MLLLTPVWVQYLFDMALVATSSLWLVRNWHRSPALYSRENLAERFRRQLAKLGLDLGRFLEGRSLSDLNPDELYVLARVLPEFGNDQRHDAYKGVVRDALAEGYVNIASSLDVLRRMRQELGISDDEHRLLLEELGVEDPSLLDPDQRRSLEDQVRLSGYRRSLERVLRLQQQLAGTGTPETSQNGGISAQKELAALVRQFSISMAEEAEAIEILDPVSGAAHRADLLLDRLAPLHLSLQALAVAELQHQPLLVCLKSGYAIARSFAWRASCAPSACCHPDRIGSNWCTACSKWPVTASNRCWPRRAGATVCLPNCKLHCGVRLQRRKLDCRSPPEPRPLPSWSS